jgi:thiol-disulfide isomerase/thioredoxin
MKKLAFLFFLLFFFLEVFSSDKLEVFLFYSPQCKACLSLKKDFLPKVFEKYKDSIIIKGLNTQNNPANLSLLLSLSAHFKKKDATVPAILVGDKFLVGKSTIEENLEEAIQEVLRTRAKLPLFFSQERIIERFKEYSFFTLIWAGLVDGINPCAFAVIVFFVSFLAVYGYKREEILCIGTFYILAVFITYLLIGLGLFGFLYTISNFYLVIKIFYYFVASFCFILFALALYDYFRYKKTKQTDGLILQLPKFLKKRINLVIGTGLRKKRSSFLSLSIISFIVGMLVSILEAVCTGQVYLPTIFFILKVPHLRLKAIFYLIVYNLMFVAPLILIFLLSFLGFRSQQFNIFLRRNLGAIKLVMALLFLVLGFSILLIS